LRGAGARQVTATDADVALSGEQHRQPDGRGVEHRRQVVNETKIRVTPVVRDPVILGAERKKPDIDGQRPYTSQRIGERYSDEDGVGGRAHGGSDQHDADENVADNDDQHQ